ncbi:aminotransferase class V-fold PLP-dependent enzyme [Roseivirga sp. BDSF3-8]|uniref:aminotransferase class V-fold PLP-dependent enzyme n=1 Tax=Roseivirga sp. BDSF3-8 TaxID=3241598 RepID=UPI0035320901
MANTDHAVQSTTAIDRFDINKVRQEFPILEQEVNGKPLAYFDNAATTQKPSGVINALSAYYSEYNANIHRGIHTLAEKATAAFEETRLTIRKFLNAPETEEIIFTSGVTNGINLVASSYGRHFFKEGDEIILSGMEHHSNIVPWQLVAEATGAVIKVISVKENGELDMEAFDKLLGKKTAFVSVVHASNSLGTINPVKEIISKAHQAGAKVLVDGAQSTAHMDIDVQDLGCDFFVMSGHKVYGPTGSGALYGRRELLEVMPPFFGGGEMIKDVTFEKTTYNDIPYKFEAGTPNIADIVALKEAVNFVTRLDKKAIRYHENELMAYAYEGLMNLDGFRPVGVAKDKVSVISFIMEGLHHFDVGMMLDTQGVAVRTGHHCTQPLMDRFNIDGTIRASFAVYNTKQEIDRLVEGLGRIISRMRK